MKKQKAIISTLAGLLILGSFAVGYGLYKKEPVDKEITIGIDTSADLNLRAQFGDIQGKIVREDTLGTQTIPVNFWGDKTGLESSGYYQDVVVGHVTFEIQTTNATLQSELTVGITNNYTVSTWGATQTLAEGSWSANKKSWTGYLAVPVAANVSGAKALTFTLGVLHNTDEVALAIAEAAYTVNVKFVAAETGYDYAYVVGINGDWASLSDKYRMVPSLVTEAFQWEHKFASALGSQTVKARKLDTWSNQNKTFDITAGQVYRWTGNGADDIYLA